LRKSETINYFGSLLLAMNITRKLTYIENVGSGFSESLLEELYARMNQLVQ